MEYKYISQLTLFVLIAIVLTASGCDTTDSGEEDDEENQRTTFNSSVIGPGETYSYTFENEGTVDYYCEIHAPDMQGEIDVDSDVEAVESDTVSMENDEFNPRSLSVAPGTEVVWVNNEDHDHDIRSGNPSSDGNGGGY